MICYKYRKGWDAKTELDESLIIDRAGIEKIINTYDEEECIFGLLSAASMNQRRVSPFTATRNYCIRVESIKSNNEINLNISPIYHLGPEYVDEYKQKHGSSLAREAIIGLVQPDDSDYDMSSTQRTFALGIDAGVAFKDSKIPHNKAMMLSIDALKDGIMASLSCDAQITSKKFTWDELGTQQYNTVAQTNNV